MELSKIIKGGLKACKAVLLISAVFLLLIQSAYAVPAVNVIARGYGNSLGGTQYITNEAGNALTSGCSLEFISAGPNGVINPPHSDGTVGGDDILLKVSTVGIFGTNGAYEIQQSVQNNGTVVYVRAWNATTAAAATYYGNSNTHTITTATDPANPSPEYIDNIGSNHEARSFGTTIPKSVAGGPMVTVVSPNSGANTGPTPITITGTNFTGVNWVHLGAINLTTFFPVNATTITLTVPLGLTAGTYDITVNTANGTSAISSADQYTVTVAGVPTVTGVSPNSGANTGTTPITITGTNLSSATAVHLGATSLAITSDSATSISATVPSGLTAGTYDITVTNANGTSTTSSADQFTVQSASLVPTVTSVYPNTRDNTQDTSIMISGTNFTGVNGVHLGPTNLSFSVSDATMIIATVPSGLTPGTYDITVNTANGTSATSSADQFTVTTPGGPGGPGGSIYTKAGGIMMAYPNPFNPNDTANPLHMLFNTATGEAVDIYIFDTNARVIYQARDNQLNADRIVTWDGETSYGETAENGLYLIRVVNNGKLVARGKILVIKK